MDHVLKAIAGIRPMAQTEKENIESMRAFCSSKGTPVTGARVSEKSATKPPRRSRGGAIAMDQD